MTATMIMLMLLFFALSIPVAISIGLASLLSIKLFTDLPLLVMAQQLYIGLDKYPLLAIPLFILAGNLMEAGGISGRLVDFAKALVGGIRGGLACTCVVTCMIFAAISGSGVATTFAIGTILIPAMVRAGYPLNFAAALQATSGELGVIIPPSIPMIIYGIGAGVSIGELFVAGFGPGLLIGGALMLYVHVLARVKKFEAGRPIDRLPLGQATSRALMALSMPLVVLGGIYGGVFTPTEAASVAVFYALFIGMVVYRQILPGDLPAVLWKSVTSASIVLFIIANAGLFNYIITRAGIPKEIGLWLVQTIHSPVLFLLTVNLVLFIIGMFIDGMAALIVLAPILAPVAEQFGINPVHFGIIVVVNLALGMITPPFGVNLFAACTVARIPLEQIVTRLVPFVLIVGSCLMLITFVPQISLFLRNLIY